MQLCSAVLDLLQAVGQTHWLAEQRSCDRHFCNFVGNMPKYDRTGIRKKTVRLKKAVLKKHVANAVTI
jgi:hypothetical protein